MRTYEEVMASARDVPAFSNGTEGHGWMSNWCWAPCHTPAEKAWRDYEDGKRKHPHKDYPGGCPLIQAALLGKTPVEWLDQWKDGEPYPIDRYHCIEFRGPDDGDNDPWGGPAPRPPRAKREPKDMDPLFPRPERRVRMLKQPEPQPQTVSAGV